MIMPFGKHKGKDLNDLMETSSGAGYVDWLIENAKETIHKYPDLEEFFSSIEHLDYEKFKELPYTKTEYNDPHSGISTNGKMINTFEEYREFIAKLYYENWLKSKKEDIFKTFGEPVEYPFIITLRTNTYNPFNGIELHKIYLREKPSVYTYSESYY